MDLIDRQRLKDDIAVLFERNEKLIDEWLANCVDDVIDEQPTVDAVPMVRCKDCQYWERDVIFQDGWCRGKRQGDPKWFCADGERRTDDAEVH